jgi:NADH-ubiquinone oxidoreductase chain 6
MHNLFLVLDNITNGFSIYTLEFIYISSIFCAIFVIINKNPILSVLFLIALFLIISIYLILLGLNFLGLSYLLVYVGAVSILFLFILMLINIRISELSTDTRNSYPLGIIAFIIFYSFISVIIPINMQQINILDLFNESTNLLNENNPLIYSISNT